MRQTFPSTIDPSWARHALAANGFGDAVVVDATHGSVPGQSVGCAASRPLRWADAIANALRALAGAARARAAERRQRRLARETYLVLNGLDGRTLRDLGFDRSEIASVANEVAGLTGTTRAHPERFNEGR